MSKFSKFKIYNFTGYPPRTLINKINFHNRETSNSIPQSNYFMNINNHVSRLYYKNYIAKKEINNLKKTIIKIVKVFDTEILNANAKVKKLQNDNELMKMYMRRLYSYFFKNDSQVIFT